MNKNEEFKKLIGKHKIVLYGAGNLGKIFLRILKKYGVDVFCFLDANAENLLLIDGIPVYSLVENKINDKSNLIVFVSVFNRDIDFSKIKDNLLSQSYTRIYSFIDLYSYFYKEIGDWFWLTPQPKMFLMPETAEIIKSLFSDEKSKTIFESTIAARLHFDYHLLPEPDPICEQYFSADVPLRKAGVFIDCGAYDGDTIDVIKDFLPSVEHVIAFEPDIKNFNRLAYKAQNTYSSQFKSFISFPCGCWSESILLHFSDGSGEASSIGAEGNVTIQGISLSDAIVNIKPDYIKMDIEGAEYNALIGCKRIIYKYQPDLAICVYHKPEDLFRIITLINSWNLNYKFYLRQYGFFGLEQVLYAVQTN